MENIGIKPKNLSDDFTLYPRQYFRIQLVWKELQMSLERLFFRRLNSDH